MKAEEAGSGTGAADGKGAGTAAPKGEAIPRHPRLRGWLPRALAEPHAARHGPACAARVDSWDREPRLACAVCSVESRAIDRHNLSTKILAGERTRALLHVGDGRKSRSHPPSAMQVRAVNVPRARTTTQPVISVSIQGPKQLSMSFDRPDGGARTGCHGSRRQVGPHTPAVNLRSR